MKKTLLEKAIANRVFKDYKRKTRSKFDGGELALLAIAWADGRLRTKDVVAAIGCSPSNRGNRLFPQ